MLREMRLEDAEALREINADQLGYDIPSVSYTHLTLPTICSV